MTTSGTSVTQLRTLAAALLPLAVALLGVAADLAADAASSAALLFLAAGVPVASACDGRFLPVE